MRVCASTKRPAEGVCSRFFPSPVDKHTPKHTKRWGSGREGGRGRSLLTKSCRVCVCVESPCCRTSWLCVVAVRLSPVAAVTARARKAFFFFTPPPYSLRRHVTTSLRCLCWFCFLFFLQTRRLKPSSGHSLAVNPLLQTVRNNNNNHTPTEHFLLRHITSLRFLVRIFDLPADLL